MILSLKVVAVTGKREKNRLWCSRNTHTQVKTLHVRTLTHKQSGHKCRCEEMKAAVLLWLHLACYIYLIPPPSPPTPCAIFLIRIHWLFHQQYNIRSKSKVKKASSNRFPSQNIHKFLFTVRGFTHLHGHTWELPTAALFLYYWLLSNCVAYLKSCDSL